MKFDTPATTNPIDQLKVIGKPTDRIDGPLKTTGTAPYAYERHDAVRTRPMATSSAPPSPRAASPRST
jgi:CO/xanthine dehydrogenase Mo-binding subunit